MTDQKFLQDLEKKLWTSANKLLPSLDAAVYKHVVLGMVFLKYVSDSFETRRQELIGEFTNPKSDYYLSDNPNDELVLEELENRDFYTEKNIFWVPATARWNYIQNSIRLSLGSTLPLGGEFKGAGKLLDDTMEAIEKENPKLKRILNKNYAQLQIEQNKLADLFDLISTIPFTHHNLKAKDILGHVYEYFLGQFASAEGKKGGQFYTPKSIVNLIVEMIEPYKGRIYDPAMGSGGFFISSEKFIEAHNGRIGDISIYGQESNPTTWRLAAMNMAIRGLDFNFGKEPADTLVNDLHPDLRANFVLANPPFNQSEWWSASLENDARWKDYPTPPKGNANFAWMLHMLYHSDPSKGVVGLVLANGSLSSTNSGEGLIREKIVKDNLVECIIALPKQLFYNTGIPATIWILRRGRDPKDNQTLFIDASELGYMKTRVIRDFTDKEIAKIEETYKKWRNKDGYEDIAGFCKSATLEDIAGHDFVLTPGRYVGIVHEEDDDVSFEEKMEHLTAILSKQMEQEKILDDEIKEQLLKIGYSL